MFTLSTVLRWDCVYVALFRSDLLPRRPDLCASGINHGPNLGSDVVYSGTVAAAREAALRGIPSIAFSCVDPRSEVGFEKAAACAATLCQRLLQASHPKDQAPLLNVNFPEGDAKGCRATRLGLRHYSDGVDVRKDPRGLEYYWIGGPGGVRHESMEGADTQAIDDRYISITPLGIESTHSDHFGIAAYVAGPREENEE